MIKQTGNIPSYPKPEDYVLGGETAVQMTARVTTGDWTPYLPTTEKQYSITFDTLSCTSFSFCNLIETQMNYLLKNNQIPQEQVEWLKIKGYIDDTNTVNFSDRFVAITSGTKKTGNDLRTVAETARTKGLIPDMMFPFGGSTWDEYHNKNLITKEMNDTATEFLTKFDIKWQWVFFDQDPKMSDDNFNASIESLKTAPLQIGIPTPATHATSLVALSNFRAKVFDTYEPFLFENTPDAYQIHFALMPVITVKEQPKPILYPKVTFSTTLKYGMRNNAQVKQWQEFLIAEKLLATGLNTGNFFDKTLIATKNFQAKYGIETVGQVGPKTRAKANEIIAKKA